MNTEEQIIAPEDNSQVKEQLARSGPGIWLSLAWIVLYFVLQFLVQFVLIIGFNVIDFSSGAPTEAAMAAAMKSPGMAMATLWALIISGGITLFILWLVYGRKGGAATSPLKISLPKLIGIAVLLLAFSYGFNFLYETYVIPGVESQKIVTDMLKAVPKDAGSQMLMFLAIAVMAPIVEEVLFRWGLQNALNRYMPAWAAIAVAAFAFALVHGQPAAIPMLFIMGAVFGYLYYLSGSLKTNIALHIINNGLASLALYLESTGALGS